MAGTLFVIAGHDLAKDPGAIGYDGSKEAELTHQLRELICEELPQALAGKGVAMEDPDDKDLVQTIRWVNDNAKEPGKSFGLDIHFNYNAPGASGVETFYSANTSQENIEWAKELSSRVAKAIGIPMRETKPDTAVRFGRLGILRDTTPRFLLLEVCFMNATDLPMYRDNMHRVAKEIASFLKERMDILNR